MRLIRSSASLLVYFDELVYLEAALLARPDTAQLASHVSALLDRWQPLFDRHLSARREAAQINARVAVADLNLDVGLRGLYSAALAHVLQNRQDPAFRGLFTDTIAVLVRPGLQRQVQVAGEVLQRLLDLQVVPQGLRDGFAAPLQAAIELGTKTLAARVAAEVARVGHRFDVESFKTEVNALRTALYGELLQRGAATGNAKDFADAFFPGVENEDGAAAPATPAADAQPAV